MTDRITTLLCSNCRHPVATVLVPDLLEPDQTPPASPEQSSAIVIPAQSRRVFQMRLTRLPSEIVL